MIGQKWSEKKWIPKNNLVTFFEVYQRLVPQNSVDFKTTEKTSTKILNFFYQFLKRC